MLATPEQLINIITDIHRSPHMMVLEFAGAGAQALAWLHSVGGSSRTVLEATDRYASTSLIEAIGFAPTQFTSPAVARAMAAGAYRRAGQLAAPDTPVVGVGCTATIATDRAKWGQHRCCVAVCNARGISTYLLTMVKGLRVREAEEELVSRVIIRAVAKASGLSSFPALELQADEHLLEQFEPMDLLTRLLNGELEWVDTMPDSQQVQGETWSNLALLSGSFNPLHSGHRELARIASELLQQEVFFELPLINADKAPLDAAEARRRFAQFSGNAPAIISRAPLFSQKAKLFPKSTFILGIDTVERLVHPRFYHNNRAEMLASFEAMRQADCRFLVAGRVRDDYFITLKDINLPAGYEDLFDEIPEKEFRVDVSSTAIRNGSTKDKPG